MAAAIPFQEIRDKARPVLESLCRRWLPTGHRSGNWWVANCPWRKDSTASLGVSLTTGHWQDFGGAVAGRESGDIVKLCACCHNIDMVDAADTVARNVGHDWRKARR